MPDYSPLICHLGDTRQVSVHNVNHFCHLNSVQLIALLAQKFIKFVLKISLGVSSKKDNSWCVMSSATSVFEEGSAVILKKRSEEQLKKLDVMIIICNNINMINKYEL